MRPWLAVAACLVLAGCADSHIAYRASEPGPGPGGPFGGDGTIDMVAAYFSFDIDAEEAHGHMGSHCGFSDWSLEPPSARVHIGEEAAPQAVVMRQVHPDQSTEGIAHLGTAPSALWRHHDVPRSFGDGELGTVVFGDGFASFHGLEIPTERWMLVETHYSSESGDVAETLHLRHFPDAAVEFDRQERLCA